MASFGRIAYISKIRFCYRNIEEFYVQTCWNIRGDVNNSRVDSSVRKFIASIAPIVDFFTGYSGFLLHLRMPLFKVQHLNWGAKLYYSTFTLLTEKSSND